MKYIVKTIYIIFSIFFLIYLILPGNLFPPQLPDSLQSGEPADTEVANRRSYFTNLDRESVIGYFTANFSLGFLKPLRLNYPPEEAQTIIRDQARSTFLEELVYPFRESLFINGFKPKSEKDTINIENQIWVQKITVKYVSSNFLIRSLIGIATLLTISILIKAIIMSFFEIKKEAIRLILLVR